MFAFYSQINWEVPLKKYPWYNIICFVICAFCQHSYGEISNLIYKSRIRFLPLAAYFLTLIFVVQGSYHINI